MLAYIKHVICLSAPLKRWEIELDENIRDVWSNRESRFSGDSDKISTTFGWKLNYWHRVLWNKGLVCPIWTILQNFILTWPDTGPQSGLRVWQHGASECIYTFILSDRLLSDLTFLLCMPKLTNKFSLRPHHMPMICCGLYLPDMTWK